MTRRRGRARPSDPLAIARRRADERARLAEPGAWGIDAAALGLAANAGIEAVKAPGGRIVRARRDDVFDRMHRRGALRQGALEAVRRLQGDTAVLHRTISGGGDLAPKVDASRKGDGWTERRLAAGARIAQVLRLTGGASATLISALAQGEPVLGRTEDWREAVRRITGETLADAQGAVLRAACDNLAHAYQAYDRANRQ